MEISLTNIVRFAIDEIRRKHEAHDDAELLGRILKRGVRAELEDSVVGYEPDSFAAFPIPGKVNHRLEMFLCGQPGERNDQMARLVEIGLDAAQKNPKLLRQLSPATSPTQGQMGTAAGARRR
jgi:hypothetical protein